MVGEFKKVAAGAHPTLCLAPLLTPCALRDSTKGLSAPEPCSWGKVRLPLLGPHFVLTLPASLSGLRVCFTIECDLSCGILFSMLVLVYTISLALPSGCPALGRPGLLPQREEGHKKWALIAKAHVPTPGYK